MSVISQSFKNYILDCVEDVIITTAADVAEAMIPKIQRRPHIETVRKALSILAEEGLVESEKRGTARGGWNHIYRIARTKPIIGSLRKAA